MFSTFIEHARDAIGNLVHNQNTFAAGRNGGGGGGMSFPFGSAAAAAGAAAGHPPEPRQKTPPASTKAIRMLPTIRVAPEDLIDPNNRECCICLESNDLDDRVVRLPCAHIFHSSCVVDWLANHSCTCPVCRYELPTDDARYEVGRLERMKFRKPRYAMHELKKLSVSDLLALKNRMTTSDSGATGNNSVGAMEKSELIQWLIDHERVDIIPAPEPVRYELHQLKQMRVKDLRSTMEEAGVFFRKEDVVEKADMLTIFLNSGRLELISTDEPTEEEDSKAVLSATTETVASTLDQKPAAIETTTSSTKSSFISSTISSTSYQNGIRIETVTEDDSDSDDNNDINDTNRKRLKCPNDTTHEFTPQVMFPGHDSGLVDGDSHLSQRPIDLTAGNEIAADVRPAESPIETDLDTTDNRAPLNCMDIDDHENDSNHDPAAASTAVTSADAAAAVSSSRHRSTFDHYSVQQLQALAEDAGIDVSHAVEREDIVYCLESVGLVGNNDGPDAMLSIKFDPWSISQLRAVASVAKIDVSDCCGREEIIHKMLFEINYVRPTLRDLIRSIPPFHLYSTSDLRGVARDLNVDISGCLEKDEIIYRLISRASNFES